MTDWGISFTFVAMMVDRFSELSRQLLKTRVLVRIEGPSLLPEENKSRGMTTDRATMNQ